MSPDQKLDKIYDIVFDMKTEIAKSIVHQENHAKEILLHSQEISNLKDYKNKDIGKNTVISIFSGSIFGGIVGWIVKHL